MHGCSLVVVWGADGREAITKGVKLARVTVLLDVSSMCNVHWLLCDDCWT